MALSVRIGRDDHETLKSLAETTDRSMADLMRDAIQDLKRKFVLEATNSAYQATREDEAASREDLAERETWELATVTDADLEEDGK